MLHMLYKLAIQYCIQNRESTGNLDGSPGPPGWQPRL